MVRKGMSQQRSFILPTSIVTPTDVSRLLREVESLESFFQQDRIRAGGEKQPALPRLSKLMDSLVEENQLSLLKPEHRTYIVESLEYLHSSAPVIHMSFSVDPPGAYTQKIVSWMRANIHTTVLITVGLQPNIGAGCVMRTTNKIFDFSLREYFHEKRDFFITEMHKTITAQTGPSPVVATETAVPVKTESAPAIAEPAEKPAIAAEQLVVREVAQ